MCVDSLVIKDYQSPNLSLNLFLLHSHMTQTTLALITLSQQQQVSIKEETGTLSNNLVLCAGYFPSFAYILKLHFFEDTHGCKKDYILKLHGKPHFFEDTHGCKKDYIQKLHGKPHFFEDTHGCKKDYILKLHGKHIISSKIHMVV
jgi:hypothetical protein